VNTNLTRDHLANERTFLAWVRTALGLIGLGFVLARMGLFLRQLAEASLIREGRGIRFHTGSEFLVSGVVFLILGTTVCGWAGKRYGENRRDIDGGGYVPAGRSVVALTSLVVAGGVAIAAMVVWRTFGSVEP
jgi:putative membrane protein